MGYLRGFLAAIVLVVLIVAAAIWSGAYDVAASDADSDFVAWALGKTMERSVRRRAERVQAPEPFTPEQVRAGFREYDEMCVQCHGAPGVEPEHWTRGLRPRPPDLAEEAAHWKPAELFWIVKHGIRMTAMPALGKVHDDATLWSVVAFLRELPAATPESYDAMRRQLDDARDSHGDEEHERASEGARDHAGGGAADAGSERPRAPDAEPPHDADRARDAGRDPAMERARPSHAASAASEAAPTASR